MSVAQGSSELWPIPADDDEKLLDRDSLAFFGSLVVHLAVLISLGVSPLLQPEPQRDAVTIFAPPTEELEEELIKLPEDFYISDQPTPEVGANSSEGAAMAMSAAQVLSEVSAVPSPIAIERVDEPLEIAPLEINQTIEIATGPQVSNLAIRGAAGVGATGAVGAVDRITQEILLSLEERKTLVVWVFDQSPSMNRQRQTIHDRFDRIYKELGVIEAAGNPAFKRHDDKPLLTSVMAFGDKVDFLLDKPTDSLAEIKQAVASIKQDDTGIEHIFSALYMAGEKYRKYRTESPTRNVMMVVFSDEVGDDQDGLDRTVNMFRRLEIPVYVVGVPAPFGLDETLVKWVDPDPNYDQTPQWGRVSQGPESLLPERVKLRFPGNDDPDPMDSGFGPFALTRLCYETGGIYFAVHPNRNVTREVSRGETAEFSAYIKNFFDSEVMAKYRPDYLPAAEYLRRVNTNKARTALLQAARMSWLAQLEAPQMRFVKTSEADLANALTEAQKAAAKLEPQLIGLYETLQLGESDRGKEITPRWQAGYDLAIGRVLAAKVRTEGYNAMLAAAKRGLKFKDEKNNTWQLRPSSDISTGSQLAKAAQSAQEYLQRVVKDHPNTPWALLAEKELQTPLGWEWQEDFTNLAPPPRTVAANNNAPPRPPRPETRNMLPPPPPRREPPKL